MYFNYDSIIMVGDVIINLLHSDHLSTREFLNMLTSLNINQLVTVTELTRHHDYISSQLIGYFE